MAKVIEITNPLTGQPRQVIQSDYTAQQIDDAVSAVQPSLPGGPGLPVSQGGTGANTPQMALVNLGARPNRNLFRGWYFVGGGSQLGHGIFPINQNGETQYTGAVYGIDGWKGVYGSEKVTIKSDCVSFEFSRNQGVKQELDKDVLNAISGNVCTASIIWRLVSGSYANFGVSVNEEEKLVPPISVSGNFVLTSVTFDLSNVSASSGYGTISGDGVIEAIACKLEVSPIQTLAYQKIGQLQLLEKPNFGEELALCQQYFWDSGKDNFGGCSGVAVSTKGLACSCIFPVTMRSTPAISVFSNGVKGKIRDIETGAEITLPDSTAFYANKSGLSYIYTFADTFTVGHGYSFQLIANSEL